MPILGSTPAKYSSPWLVVAFLWVAFFINYVDRLAVFSIYPVLKRDLLLSNAQLGLVGTVFIWTYSLCMPFTGRLADVFRRERIVVASIVLWSLATLGTGLSHSALPFLLWRACVGLTEALYVPAALGLIAALHPAATRSRALAAHSTAQYIGILGGGWYGGWTADHVGWRWGFAALAVVGVVYALYLSKALRGPEPGPMERVSRRNARSLEVFESRCYVALCLAFFMFCLMLWMLYAWLPDFLYERFHLSMSQSGLAATLYLQVSSAVGVACGGVLGDHAVKTVRGARFYATAAGAILSAPFAYLAFSSGSLLSLKIFACAFGLTGGLLMSNQFAASYDVTPERNYGFAAGALNMVGGLAGGAGILAAGLWKASIGIAHLMFWCSVATVVSGCVLAWVTTAFFRRERTRVAEIDRGYSAGEVAAG